MVDMRLIDNSVFHQVKSPQDFRKEHELMRRAREEFEMRKQMQQAQIGKLQSDAQIAAMGGNEPSNVREWHFYNDLPEEQKPLYLQMKRADKVVDTGSGYSTINQFTGQADPVSGGLKNLTPQQMVEKAIEEREAQDGFNRGLDVKRKALAAVERLVGKENAQGELEGGNIEGVRSNRGLSSWLPNLTTEAIDAQADLDALTNLMTTENLGLLKGVLSDTDMRVLQSIGAGELQGSDKKVLGALRRMRAALTGQVSEMQPYIGQRGMPPLPSSFYNNSVDIPPPPDAPPIPPAPKFTLSEIEESIFEAQKAVKRGADRQAVRARLIQNGIDPAKAGL